jgi:tetratricopeptide (TPR) repeat protein
MSRSIHTTRRSIKKIFKGEFPNREERKKALDKAIEELTRKRWIKRQVKKERNSPPAPQAAPPALAIPINIQDQGPFIHYSASIEDIQTILKALPIAAVEGISKIQLRLAKQYLEEREDKEEGCDPYTGRRSVEIIPGIYSGEVLGTYYFKTRTINLHAEVYDPAHVPLPLPICQLFLRLRALNTFVHEVAHHHDMNCRVARGRWLADRKENVEAYAEKMEYAWARNIVIPYLQRQYPNEVRAFRKWVAHRGGIMMPLEFFAGDPRTTHRNGSFRLIWSGSDAFESWMKELPKCKSLAESRLAFAWELHYSDAYEECLQVLNRILDAEPEHLETLTLKADTLVHLERDDEAFTIAESVLGRDATISDAWETRADVLQHRKEWHQLLENCQQWEKNVKLSKYTKRILYRYRATALCALDRESEMEEAIKVIFVNIVRPHPKREAFIRRNIFRNAGKPLPDDPLAQRPS